MASHTFTLLFFQLKAKSLYHQSRLKYAVVANDLKNLSGLQLQTYFIFLLLVHCRVAAAVSHVFIPLGSRLMEQLLSGTLPDYRGRGKRDIANLMLVFKVLQGNNLCSFLPQFTGQIRSHDKAFH